MPEKPSLLEALLFSKIFWATAMLLLFLTSDWLMSSSLCPPLMRFIFMLPLGLFYVLLHAPAFFVLWPIFSARLALPAVVLDTRSLDQGYLTVIASHLLAIAFWVLVLPWALRRTAILWRGRRAQYTPGP